MDGEEKLRQTTLRANLMTPRQKEIVQRDITTLERALHGQAMPYYGADPGAQAYTPPADPWHAPSAPTGHVLLKRDMPVPDREQLERSFEACQQTMALGRPPELSAAAKNTLFKWYKEEQGKYVEGMPSHEQMWKPQWQNVQQYIQHREANKRRGKLLQNIHRILEPQDDMFHLEGFRPAQATPFNGKAFREGYDQISWTDEKELALQAQELDDATYLAFLQYRAQGIDAPKLYEEKLGISRQQYEACMARLKMSAVVVEAERQEDDASARMPAPPPRRPARGRPRRTDDSQDATPISLSEQVEKYTPMLATLAEESPLSIRDASEILCQVEPTMDATAAQTIAEEILHALATAGTLVQMDDGQYSAASVGAASA